MTRGLLHTFCAVLLVSAWPLAASAQDDAFKQGMQARGDKKWADAVRYMQAAVKADGQESTRKVRSGFLGVNGMEYLPHYFLGEAFFNQGDCAGAVTEWSTSEQQGIIRNRPDFLALMRKNLQACAAKGVCRYNVLEADRSKPMFSIMFTAGCRQRSECRQQR